MLFLNLPSSVCSSWESTKPVLIIVTLNVVLNEQAFHIGSKTGILIIIVSSISYLSIKEFPFRCQLVEMFGCLMLILQLVALILKTLMRTNLYAHNSRKTLSYSCFLLEPRLHLHCFDFFLFLLSHCSSSNPQLWFCHLCRQPFISILQTLGMFD